MIIHCCIDVRGYMRGPKRNLAGLFRDSAGRRLTPDEARDVLMDHLAAGHEVITVGPACEGFDYKTGCPGHAEDGEQ